jgi:hypothetical protein
MDWAFQPMDSKCASDKEQAAQPVAQLKKIVSAFLKANPGYPAKGYAQARLIPICETQPLFKDGCEANRLRGQVDVLVSGEDQVVFGAGGRGRPSGRKYDTEGGIGGFSVSVNQIPTLGGLEALSSLREVNNAYWVLTQLQTTSTFQGYPVRNHTHIVISPPGYPPE